MAELVRLEFGSRGDGQNADKKFKIELAKLKAPEIDAAHDTLKKIIVLRRLLT